MPLSHAGTASRALTVALLLMLEVFGASGAQAVGLAQSDGGIAAGAIAGGRLYVGGEITAVDGFIAVGGVVLGRGDGLATRDFPGIPDATGTIETSASDGHGGWYVGGTFTFGPVRNLAHVLADGSVDTTFHPNPNLSVRTLTVLPDGYWTQQIYPLPTNLWPPASFVLSGATVYIAGTFTRVGGVARKGLAQVLSSGVVTDWAPETNGIVFSILAVRSSDAFAPGHGDSVYLGGAFSQVTGMIAQPSGGATRTTWPARNFTLVDAGSALLDVFAPLFNGSSVGALAVNYGPTDTTVYVGGLFSDVNGVPVGSLAAWDIRRGLTPWRPFLVGGGVGSLAIGQSTFGMRIFVSGDFTGVQSPSGIIARPGLASITSSGLVDAGWNPQNPGVGSLATDGERVIMVGDATTTTAVDATSGSKLSWGPDELVRGSGFGPRMSTVSVSGQNVFVGGRFISALNYRRSGGFAIDLPNGKVADWNPKPSPPNFNLSPGVIWSMSSSGGRLYAAGNFTRIGSVARGGVAAFDGASGQVLPWTPALDSASKITRVLATDSHVFVGGDLLIGGEFRTLAALSPIDGHVEWSLDSRRTTVWPSGLLLRHLPRALGTTVINGLAVLGDMLFVTGEFDMLGGVARRGAASVDLGTGAVSSWDPSAPGLPEVGAPTALAVNAEGVYIASAVSTDGYLTSKARITLVDPDGPIDPVRCHVRDFTIPTWTYDPLLSINTLQSYGELILGAGNANLDAACSSRLYALQGFTVLPCAPLMMPSEDPREPILLARDGSNLYWSAYSALYSSSFDPPVVSAQVAPMGADALAIATLAPNPFSADIELRFRVPNESHVTLSILDISGRIVRRGLSSLLAPGIHAYRWNGLDDSGRAAAPGIYFAIVEAKVDTRSEVRATRIVRLQ